MASLVLNHNSYYAVFSVSGKRKWIKIGRVDKKKAKQILRKLEIEFTKDRLNLDEVKSITLYEFIEEYIEFAKTNKSIATCKRELEIMQILKSNIGDIPLQKIDTHKIEEYKTNRTKKSLKPATINKELSVLRFMSNKAKEWAYQTSTPKIKLLKIPKEPPKFLSTEEIDRLVDKASTWLKPIIIVLRNTGLRRGELLNLKFSYIDFNQRVLLIRSSKTNSYRIIPMNKELYETLLWLRDYYPLPHMDKVIPRQDCQREYIFCMPDGRKLKSFRHSFNKACRKAGIKASPHTLRHSFASHLVMCGVDLVSVKELLGHTQVSTTMIYAHLSPSYKASTVEKLPWI